LATDGIENKSPPSNLQGSFAERLGDVDRAFTCYESALRNNANSTTSLNSIAGICRVKELYPKAIEYFQRILNIEGANGEVWGAIGHCNLMMDELQQAYNAYQQALYHLPNPKVCDCVGAYSGRIRSFGMGLGSCMIGMDRLSMQRKRLLL
jgi:tetratricopeptide (TPR) repeat protein